MQNENQYIINRRGHSVTLTYVREMWTQSGRQASVFKGRTHKDEVLYFAFRAPQMDIYACGRSGKLAFLRLNSGKTNRLHAMYNDCGQKIY